MPCVVPLLPVLPALVSIVLALCWLAATWGGGAESFPPAQFPGSSLPGLNDPAPGGVGPTGPGAGPGISQATRTPGSAKVFCGQIGRATDEASLQSLLGPYGEIQEVSIIKDKFTMESKGRPRPLPPPSEPHLGHARGPDVLEFCPPPGRNRNRGGQSDGREVD